MNLSNQNFNLEEFSKKSEKYYEEIKGDLELKYKGKYAALDYKSKKYWIGETASEALEKAKKDYPDQFFYVILVGSVATFSVQLMSKCNLFSKKPYDLKRAYR